ncbi:MAG: M4 family metallopeptidase [Candidatus Dormibacteraeota bacterium]|nr:M4 family metallopeptidase [Candidatus Dormibacteraeota bacterium]
MSHSDCHSVCHSVCHIVPPGLLEQLIRTGSPEQREVALATLTVDHSIRSARLQAGLVAAPGPLRTAAAHGGAGKPDRTIYDALHQQDTAATTVLRTEGQPPAADPAANEAYDGLGDTYSFYWDVFQRDSIDDSGLSLLGEVHYGQAYDNAFWDGERMVFGDGDGQLFLVGGFTKAIDVIGHELTHGVTQSTLGLRYIGQSGALNESISDVFGSMVKQKTLGQPTATADWLIGAGITGPAMPGQALRSMKAPGTAYRGDPQPATMSGYVRTTNDNGGVHTNSGIPNHAFYLLAAALGGNSWDRAGRIWYEVMVRRAVPPTAQFHTFATATVAAAQGLYGAGSAEVTAVTDAWHQVEVL